MFRSPLIQGLMAVWIAVAHPAGAQVAWDVDTPDDLIRILPIATPGDTFSLAPGTWGALSLAGVSGADAGHLTIRGADPADPPLFTRIDLTGSAHISLSDLRLEPEPTTTALPADGAKDIALTNIAIAGSGTGTGLSVSGANGVSIDALTLSGLARGIAGRDVRQLTLSDSRMTGLTGAAVEIEGGAWLTLDGNRFTDFAQTITPHDHAPRAMVTIAPGATAPDHILIKDTLLDIGTGPARPGLWIGDVHEKRDDLPAMHDVTISGNVIVTATRDGLVLGPVGGASVQGNAVLRTRQGAHRDTDRKETGPEIQISERARDLVLHGNWAADLPRPEGLLGWDAERNHLVQDRYAGQDNHYDKVFTAPDAADPLAAFRPRPDGLLSVPDSGPSLLRGPLAEQPQIVALTSSEPEGPVPLRPRLRYDPDLGRMIALDRSGAARIAQDADTGSIPLGDAFPIVDIPREMVAPIFDISDFALTLRLRGRDGWRNGGEVLRIHHWMILNVDDAGGLVLHFRSAETPWKRLALRTARLRDGAWHDVTITFDTSGDEGVLQMSVDDQPPTEAAMWGKTPILEYWGLSLGNPFGDRDTWEGEIGALTLSSRSAP